MPKESSSAASYKQKNIVFAHILAARLTKWRLLRATVNISDHFQVVLSFRGENAVNYMIVSLTEDRKSASPWEIKVLHQLVEALQENPLTLLRGGQNSLKTGGNID